MFGWGKKVPDLGGVESQDSHLNSCQWSPIGKCCCHQRVGGRVRVALRPETK